MADKPKSNPPKTALTEVKKSSVALVPPQIKTPETAQKSQSVKTVPQKPIAQKIEPIPQALKAQAIATPDIPPQPKITPKTETIMTDQKAQITQVTEQVTQMNQECVQCATAAGGIFANRCEEIMRAITEIAQKSAQNNATYLQRAMASPTLNTLADISRESWQQSLSAMVEGATRISELTFKAISEASAPVAEHVSKTAERASKSVGS